MKNVITVLVLCLSAFAGESARSFVVIYQYDGGRCVPYMVYPEGGCPHEWVFGREYFPTKESALAWLNEHTDQDSPPIGVYVIATPRVAAQSVELLEIKQEIPLKLEISDKTYDTYETKTVPTTKLLKVWQEQQPRHDQP